MRALIACIDAVRSAVLAACIVMLGIMGIVCFALGLWYALGVFA